jgi:hypothetical protein
VQAMLVAYWFGFKRLGYELATLDGRRHFCSLSCAPGQSLL